VSAYLPAQRYAGAVYTVAMCPSVRLSVTSQYCIKTVKRMGSQKPRLTIARGL